MKKLRESSDSEQSAIDGEATSAPANTIHATQGVTVVLTVAVDGARLARTVAIRWHRTRDREGLTKTGTPPAEGVTTTITYSFAADRPGTFTYRARYGRDRAACLVDARGGGEAEPSDAGGRARAHAAGPSSSAGRRARARAAARHGVVNVNVPPRRDEVPNADNRAAGRPASTAVRRADGPTGRHGVVNVNVPPRREEVPNADSRVSTAVRRADGRARGRRGMACVEAQLMADCPVIYYDGAEYDGGAPVLRLLRWSAAALAAAALWVSGICGPRDPDVPPTSRVPP